MTAESLNIRKTVVVRNMKEDLGKRNLCARFVPHFVAPEQREGRVISCQEIIAMADADKIFFNNIIKGDETWCFAEWVGETSPRPKKLKFLKVPHQEYVDNFFRLSRRSAQRIHTRWKKSKCRIL
jgi:hypothetical protein